MKRKYLLISYLLFSITIHHNAQKVKIFGEATDCSNKFIYPYLYADEITNLEEDLNTIYVDDSGKFKIEIDITETKQIFLPLGANKGFIYIEPFTEYEILLPPFEEKEIRDKLNPYFVESEIQIGIINAWKKGIVYEENELNFMINSFDNSFEDILNQITINTFYYKKNINLDSIEVQLDKIFYGSENQFFNDYKYYKIGVLKYNSSVKPSTNQFIKEYFENKPINYNNPAYMELFHLVFNKFIISYLENINTKKQLEEAFIERNYHKLINALTIENSKINDSLSEFVLLKEVYDGLYSKEFPNDLLIQIIDSLYFNSTIPEHKSIAQNIREKTTRLLPGYFPPDFILTGENNYKYSLKDFKGKFVYLNFISIQSLACVKDFGILNTLQEKYKDILSIVSISVDESFDNTLFYKEKKELNWTFLHDENNPGILKKYNIKAYPTYYLIDPEGKILLSPAPSPEENFEIIFFEVLKSKGLIQY